MDSVPEPLRRYIVEFTGPARGSSFPTRREWRKITLALLAVLAFSAGCIVSKLYATAFLVSGSFLLGLTRHLLKGIPDSRALEWQRERKAAAEAECSRKEPLRCEVYSCRDVPGDKRLFTGRINGETISFEVSHSELRYYDRSGTPTLEIGWRVVYPEVKYFGYSLFRSGYTDLSNIGAPYHIVPTDAVFYCPDPGNPAWSDGTAFQPARPV